MLEITPDLAGPELTSAIASIEAWLAAQRDEQGLPGLSAIIVHDQDVLWAKGFGYADLKNEVPATPRTVYRVASNTKLFTATMLMQLRDAGKLSLDDPIERYLPEFTIKSRFSDPRPLTFRQVAAHAAGLPREAPLEYWATLEFPSAEEVLASMQDAELILPPMTVYKYSNLGYAILGIALERIAGVPYREYVKKNILRPLGMDYSGFSVTPEMQPYLAVGYIKNDPDAMAPFFDNHSLASVGQLYSSVEDIARFISLQFRDGPAGGSQVLGSSSLREMRAPIIMNVDGSGANGIGWLLGRAGKYLRMYHGGGIHGFSTQLMVVPELKLGVAVFANMQGAGVVTAGCQKILDVFVPILEQARERARAAARPKPRPEWQKFVGAYVFPGALIETEVQIKNGRLVMTELDSSPVKVLCEIVSNGDGEYRKTGTFAEGERVVFEMNEAGEVIRMKIGSYPLTRR